MKLTAPGPTWKLPGVRAAFILAATLLAPTAASALSMPAPGRELTRDDQMALTVYRAGLIVIGRMLSEHDTTITSSNTFQKVRFAPERRLEGPPVDVPFTYCYLPEGSSRRPTGGPTGVRSPERSVRDERVILFLQEPRFEGGGAETYGGALERTCSWYGIEERSSQGFYLNDRQAWSGDLEREVRRAVARQDIDALIRRADMIIVGRVLPMTEKSPAHGAPYSDPPRMIAVSRTLKGLHHARRDVQPVVPFARPLGSRATETKREFVWLLRHTENGALEPVELLAGILEIIDGRIPAWGMSLEELRVRIEGSGWVDGK